MTRVPARLEVCRQRALEQQKAQEEEEEEEEEEEVPFCGILLQGECSRLIYQRVASMSASLWYLSRL